jgi:hypothetical protein
MILKKINFEAEEGQMEAIWLIDNEQYQMLVNFAVNELMRRGIVQVQEMQEQELLQSGTDEEREEYLNYLETTDKKKMFQA